KWRRKLVMAESIMAGAGLEFSLQAVLARGRLKPELQTGRPQRNGRPGPQVRSSVPTGGTPVPRALEDKLQPVLDHAVEVYLLEPVARALEDKLQPVLDHAVAAAELQRIQKVLRRDIGVRRA